ncbi:MAG: flagellar biosynthesis protein FlhF [Clostridium sp.]|nr:flagellar biosynthesis protein FlhF [Clostridium sp.]
MIIKRYLVKNVNEAMTRIRYELGKDAIIISQRKVRKPGIKGLFSGKLIEVTAAVESAEDDSKEANVKVPEKKVVSEEEEFKKSLESIRKLMEDELAVSRAEKNSTLSNMIMEHNSNAIKERENDDNTVEDTGVINEIKHSNAAKYKMQDNLSVESVHNEVVELKNLINKVMENNSDITKDSNLSRNIKEADLDDSKEVNIKKQLQEKLDELDIDEEFFDEIIRTAKEYSGEELDIKEILRDIFERELLVTTGTFRGKVALVGPTGVGKTTTIAKLAGRLALVEKKKVGLITIDTYRIGAIEQLKTYAEIMNIPFKVVITIKEMGEAIESMADCDVILIDTTGRSSKNTMQISELRAFIEKAQPDYVNMVVSATTKNKDIKNILNGYSDLGYDSVIVTKLDETTVYGSIYNIAKRADKPVSFITIGQNVPDDIKIPSKEELARFILGEETVC